MKFYTGIGSRETPKDILDIMRKLGVKLAQQGWTLRSGGAKGADWAFMEGAGSVNGLADIYVPWKNFTKSDLYSRYEIFVQGAYRERAIGIAKSIHPAWDRCSLVAKKLHARNIFQVMGEDISTPSTFVVYWAKEVDDVVKGGTATAVHFARQQSIPTYNLLFEKDKQKILKFLEEE